MPIGKCALCLKTAALQDSHFMAAGFYTIIRRADGEHPVLISKDAALLTSAQARAHLLCLECERRFNENGENWVIEHCWQSADNFPMQSALSSVKPFLDEEGFQAYEGRKIPDVEIGTLAYFGASMFWRASVHDWRIGKHKDPRIGLGPFEEKLRRYLLGESAFPDGVVLFITLSKALDDMHNRVVALPWLFDRQPDYRSYKFLVPGLTFHMFFGMRIPVPQRRICSARHGFLYMTDDGDAAKLQTMARMAQRSKRKGKLRKEAAQTV